MNKKRFGRAGVAFLVCVGVMLVAYGVSFLASSFQLTPNKVSKELFGNSAVKAEELRDENGKFHIVDYPEFDASKYVTLGDYESIVIEAEKPSDEITDEQLQLGYEAYIDYYDLYEKITEGTASKGDLITAYWTGYIDGKAITTYTKEETTFTLGESGEPEGFVENLDGAEIGSDLDFDVVLPDDWAAEEDAGKTVNFKVHLTRVNIIPELTDENISEMTGGAYETKDAFMAEMEENMRANLQEQYASEMSQELIDKLMACCTIKSIPRELLVWSVAMQIQYYQDYADHYNMTLEEYIDDSGVAESLDDMLYYMTQTAVTQSKEYLVLTALAQKEGIELDDEDSETIEYREQQLIAGLGLSDRDVLMSYYGEANVRNDVLNWKILDWLQEKLGLI